MTTHQPSRPLSAFCGERRRAGWWMPARWLAPITSAVSRRPGAAIDHPGLPGTGTALIETAAAG